MVIYLTDFFDAASRRHNDAILLPAMCSSRTVHRHTAHRGVPVHCLNSWTAASRNAKLAWMCPTRGLQTAQISVLWITRSGLSCSIVSTTDESTVWINWNGGSSMSGAVLNSRFLTRLLTSGEKDIERVFTLKEDILSTVHELTMLILSISVTFDVTCLTVTF